MPFKKTEDGQGIFIDDKGFPVYVGPDGSEKPYDVDARVKQIAELTEKASKRGQEIEELKKRLEVWKDIEDGAAFIEQAKKDAATVAAMADKDKETEASVQKRISEAVKAAVDPAIAERDRLANELAIVSGNLDKAIIGNAFGRSRYAAENLVSPALAQRLFEASFYVKDGKPVGRDADGNDIYGSEGVASFDEALCKLVEKSPFKENIVKAAPGGSGANNVDTQRTAGMLTPEQAGKLSPEAYAKARKEGKI